MVVNKDIVEKCDFDACINGNPTVVVDFSATWCGPCKMISPYFEELSELYPSIKFVKVDVDDAEEIASSCGISAMPTFQVFVGGKKVDELLGASKDKLLAMIAKYK